MVWLTKQLQMFRKHFSYKNSEELRHALMETTDEKYNELLKNVNIKLAVLKNQINTNSGVWRVRLENLVNAIEDILGSIRWRDI